MAKSTELTEYYVKVLNDALPAVSEMIKIQKAKKVDSTHVLLRSRVEVAKDTLLNTFDKVEKEIHDCKKQLLHQLAQTAEMKEKGLKKYQSRLHASIRECATIMAKLETLVAAADANLGIEGPKLAEELRKAIANRPGPFSSEVKEFAFIPNPIMSSRFNKKSFGFLKTYNVDISQVDIVEICPCPVVGRPMTFILQVFHEHKPDLINYVDIKVKCIATGHKPAIEIKDLENGAYSCTVTPTSIGLHHVKVSAFFEPIPCSPLEFVVSENTIAAKRSANRALDTIDKTVDKPTVDKPTTDNNTTDGHTADIDTTGKVVKLSKPEGRGERKKIALAGFQAVRQHLGGNKSTEQHNHDRAKTPTRQSFHPGDTNSSKKPGNSKLNSVRRASLTSDGKVVVAASYQDEIPGSTTTKVAADGKVVETVDRSSESSYSDALSSPGYQDTSQNKSTQSIPFQQKHGPTGGVTKVPLRTPDEFLVSSMGKQEKVVATEDMRHRSMMGFDQRKPATARFTFGTDRNLSYGSSNKSFDAVPSPKKIVLKAEAVPNTSTTLKAEAVPNTSTTLKFQRKFEPQPSQFNNQRSQGNYQFEEKLEPLNPKAEAFADAFNIDRSNRSTSYLNRQNSASNQANHDNRWVASHFEMKGGTPWSDTDKEPVFQDFSRGDGKISTERNYKQEQSSRSSVQESALEKKFTCDHESEDWNEGVGEKLKTYEEFTGHVNAKDQPAAQEKEVWNEEAAWNDNPPDAKPVEQKDVWEETCTQMKNLAMNETWNDSKSGSAGDDWEEFSEGQGSFQASPKQSAKVVPSAKAITKEDSALAQYTRMIAEGCKCKLTGTFVRNITGPRPQEDRLFKPIGLTVDEASSNIWVCDTGHHTVKEFSWEGELLRKLGEDGKVKLIRPSGVLVGAQGEVYVKDNYHIYKFTRDLELVRKFSGRLEQAYGLCWSPDGNILTLEEKRSDGTKVVKFSPDGQLLETSDFGPQAVRNFKSKVRFFGVNDKYLVVSDLGLDQIYLTQLNGRSVAWIGASGTDPGYYRDPSGIVADSFGNVLIGDANNHRIQIYKNNTEFCGILQLNRELKRPSDIYMTADNHVLVCNLYDSCVKVFKLTVES